MILENTQIIDEMIIEVRDKDGNIKPIFNEYKLFRMLRQFGFSFPKIPYLVGYWDIKLIIN